MLMRMVIETRQKRSVAHTSSYIHRFSPSSNHVVMETGHTAVGKCFRAVQIIRRHIASRLGVDFRNATSG